MVSSNIGPAGWHVCVGEAVFSHDISLSRTDGNGDRKRVQGGREEKARALVCGAGY